MAHGEAPRPLETVDGELVDVDVRTDRKALETHDEQILGELQAQTLLLKRILLGLQLSLDNELTEVE